VWGGGGEGGRGGRRAVGGRETGGKKQGTHHRKHCKIAEKVEAKREKQRNRLGNHRPIVGRWHTGNYGIPAVRTAWELGQNRGQKERRVKNVVTSSLEVKSTRWGREELRTVSGDTGGREGKGNARANVA